MAPWLKQMLAAQYTAAHAAIMRVARLFTRIVDLQYQDMIRTSVALYEALNRLHTGVTVGHVSVNDGGQAIVGSVTQNQQEPMTQTAPATPLLSDAIGIPMPKIEESKERVPIPVSHTEDSGP